MFIHNQYVAGFFDGEGTINFSCLHRTETRKRKQKIFKIRQTSYYEWLARCAISNTNSQVLQEFLNKYGGSLRVNKSNNRIHSNRKPLFQWIVSSKQAELFVKDIYPFLIVKKEIANLFLEFRKTFNKPGLKGLDKNIIEKRLSIIKLAHQVNSKGINPVKETPLIKHLKNFSCTTCQSDPQ